MAPLHMAACASTEAAGQTIAAPRRAGPGKPATWTSVSACTGPGQTEMDAHFVQTCVTLLLLYVMRMVNLQAYFFGFRIILIFLRVS